MKKITDYYFKKQKIDFRIQRIGLAFGLSDSYPELHYLNKMLLKNFLN